MAKQMMGSKRMVYKLLPQRYSFGGGGWWLAGEEYVPMARRIGMLLSGDNSLLEREPGVKVLKRDRNRLCFQWDSGEDSEGPAVVKSFPLKGWKNSLYRYRRYALTEAANLLSARACDIGVPEVYAYGKFSRRGLVHCCAVVMEDLSKLATMADLLQASRSQEESLKLLRGTNELLAQLYRAGCYYYDMKPAHLMMSPRCHETVRLIDMHYVRWLKKPSMKAWAVMAGLLAYHCKSYMDWGQIEGWFRETIEEMNFPETEELVQWFVRAAQRQYKREESQQIRFDKPVR